MMNRLQNLLSISTCAATTSANNANGGNNNSGGGGGGGHGANNGEMQAMHSMQPISGKACHILPATPHHRHGFLTIVYWSRRHPMTRRVLISRPIARRVTHHIL
jgi:hypothetical protein